LFVATLLRAFGKSEIEAAALCSGAMPPRGKPSRTGKERDGSPDVDVDQLTQPLGIPILWAGCRPGDPKFRVPIQGLEWPF
jgi:hypothetical protein